MTGWNAVDQDSDSALTLIPTLFRATLEAVPMLLYFIVGIVAYLLGSIPFGLILVRIFRKQDIRTAGQRQHRRYQCDPLRRQGSGRDNFSARCGERA